MTFTMDTEDWPSGNLEYEYRRKYVAIKQLHSLLIG